MYSAKEKLTHFHKLVSPTVVEADLALLHAKAPHLTDFTRFDLSPEKNHEEILFLLLDHCEHDEIVRNRREYANQAADEDNINANNSSEDGDEDPETLNSNGDESPDANSGEGDEDPSEGEGGEGLPEEESEDNESTEQSSEEPTAPSEDKDDASSKKEKAKAAPKKKKKSTRK
nr:MAG TPA: hypothetical protein [Caudoviricetes sp.]